MKDVPFLFPTGPWDGRMQYAPTTGYVRGFKKRICIRYRRWRMVGRMQYAPTTGYVLPFKKMSRFRPLRGRLWGVCDTPLRPGTCGPSKNYLVSVPFGAVCGAYSIRPYNWVRVRVQKMDLYTPPSVAYGGAYAIRPYGWVCAILRNTDAISRVEEKGRLGCGAVGATVCGGDGRE